jgi:hypothetical protein
LGGGAKSWGMDLKVMYCTPHACTPHCMYDQ